MPSRRENEVTSDGERPSCGRKYHAAWWRASAGGDRRLTLAVNVKAIWRFKPSENGDAAMRRQWRRRPRCAPVPAHQRGRKAAL